MEHTSSQLYLLFHLLFVTYIQSYGFYLLVISLVYPLLSILIFYLKCTSKIASLLGRRYLFNELIMFSIMYVIRYMQFLTHETYLSYLLYEVHLFINNYSGIVETDVNRTASTLVKGLYANHPTQSIDKFSQCDGISCQTIEFNVRGRKTSLSSY